MNWKAENTETAFIWNVVLPELCSEYHREKVIGKEYEIAKTIKAEMLPFHWPQGKIYFSMKLFLLFSFVLHT